MANIREILAKNMRNRRQELNFTQSELAEKANISTNFVAMIELKHKFPSPETLEQIAFALQLPASALFVELETGEETLSKLRQAILGDLDRAIETAVDKAIDKRLSRNVNLS